jgi:acyl carrier protein
MGLDLVELTLSIEEEFGVHIDDDSASRMETPGDVTDYLCSRLRTNPDAPCPSQAGFYRLRAALVDTFGVDKNTLYPDTPLQPILAGNIKRNWRSLQQALSANDFPQLKRSRLLFITLVVVLPALPSILLIMHGLSLTLATGLFVVLYLIANIATHRMGSVIPAAYSTVATLIPFITCGSSSIWNRDAVLARVISLTSEQLGIAEQQIQENSRFIKDLGAD